LVPRQKAGPSIIIVEVKVPITVEQEAGYLNQCMFGINYVAIFVSGVSEANPQAPVTVKSYNLGAFSRMNKLPVLHWFSRNCPNMAM